MRMIQKLEHWKCRLLYSYFTGRLQGHDVFCQDFDRPWLSSVIFLIEGESLWSLIGAQYEEANPKQIL